MLAVHHHHGTMGTLVHDVQGVVHGVARSESESGVENGISGSDGGHRTGDHVKGHVLGQNGDAAASRGDFGHAATRHGVHVGHYEGDGSNPVGCR